MSFEGSAQRPALEPAETPRFAGGAETDRPGDRTAAARRASPLNRRMRRVLTIAIAALSVGEACLVHWGVSAFRDRGLTLAEWLLAAAAAGGFNAVVFPMARRRIRATGLGLVFSRGWVMGSVTALMTGSLLGALWLLLGGAGALAGVPESGRVAFVWLGGVVVVGGFGTVAWGASVGNYRVRVDRVTLPLRGVTSELEAIRVAHVTDLHIGPLLPAERLRKFVERINGVRADIIVITGDIFDFDPEYVEAGARELGRLDARLGVFAVLGNHDVYTGAELIADALARSTAIRLLRDSWEVVEVGSSSLVIAGLDDRGEGWTERESDHEALDRLVEQIPADLPCLLLAHRPSYFAHAARRGVSLMLAGHTHGGQIAVPLALNHNPSRVISKHTRGRFERDSTTMYVNRGLGMAGLPLRINCPREIALIRFARPRGAPGAGATAPGTAVPVV